MPLPNLSGEYGLTKTPELRFTPSGSAVMNLSLAADDSKYDRETQQRSKADHNIFTETTIWRADAEAVAEMNLQPGAKVTVIGPSHMEEYQTQQGETRKKIVIEAYGFGVRPSSIPAFKAPQQGGQGGQANPQQSNNPWVPPQNNQQQPQQQQPQPQQNGGYPPQGYPQQNQGYPQQNQPQQNGGYPQQNQGYPQNPQQPVQNQPQQNGAIPNDGPPF